MRSMLGSDPFVLSCMVIIGVCAAILVIFVAVLGAKQGPEKVSPGVRADDTGAPPDR